MSSFNQEILQILNPENPSTLQANLEAVHRSDHTTRQKFLSDILKVPRSALKCYLNYVENHCSQAALDNLHFLVTHPAFQYREDVLQTLEVIGSPSSVDFLYQASLKTNLRLRKLILKTLANFPQTQVHPVLMESLAHREVEVKLLSLSILANVEKIEDSTALLLEMESPFATVRNKVLNLLEQAFGREVLIEQLQYFHSFSQGLQESLTKVLCESRLEFPLEPILSQDTLDDSVLRALLQGISFPLPSSVQCSLFQVLHHPVRSVRSSLLELFERQEILSSELQEKILDHLELEPCESLQGRWLEIAASFEKLAVDAWFAFLQGSNYSLSTKVLLEVLLKSKDKMSLKKLADLALSSTEAKVQGIALLLMDHVEIEDAEARLMEIAKASNSKHAALAEKLLQKGSQSHRIQQVAKAQEWFEKGDVAQAQWILDEVLKQDPQLIDARFLYARILHRQENYNRSEYELKRILMDEADYLPALLLLSSHFLESKNAKAAIPLLKKASVVAPNNPKISELLFDCYYLLKEFETAYRCFFDIPREFLAAESFTRFFHCACQLKKYQSVVEVHDWYLQSDYSLEQTPRFQTYLAIAQFHTQNEDWLETGMQLSQIRPLDEDTLKGLKLLSQISSENKITEIYLKAMIEYQPASHKNQMNLLEFYLETNPVQCLSSLENLSGDISYQLLEAKAHRKLGNFQESLEILEELYLKDSSMTQIPLQIGLNYFELGKYQKALKYFQYYENKAIYEEGTHYYLAACYNKCRNHDEAVREILYALEDKPCEKAWTLYAEYLSQEQYTELLEPYNEHAMAALWNYATGLKQLALSLLNIRPTAGLKAFVQLSKLTPGDHEIQLHLALHFLKEGKYNLSYQHFHKIRNKLETKYLRHYCQAAEHSLDFLEAFTLYCKLYNENPGQEYKDRIQRLIKGKGSFFQIQKGLHRSDVRQLENTLQHFPLFYYKLALRRFSQGEFKESLYYLDILQAHHQNYMRSYFFSGLIQYHTGNLKKARVSLEEALKQGDRKHFQLHGILGELYYELGEVQLAKQSFIKLYSSPKRKIDALEFLYRIYLIESSLEKFIHLVTQADKKLKEHSQVRYLLAQAYWHVDDMHACAHTLEGYPKEDLQAGSAYFLRAKALRRLERYSQGIETLEWIRENSEVSVQNLPGFYFELGMAHQSLSHFQSAIQAFSTDLELHEPSWETQVQLLQTYLACLNGNDAVKLSLEMDRLPPSKLVLQLARMLFEQKNWESLTTLFTSRFDDWSDQMDSHQMRPLFQGAAIACFHLEDLQMRAKYIQLMAPSHRKELENFLSVADLSDSVRMWFLEGAMAVIKDSFVLWLQMGLLALRSGKPENSIDFLGRALHFAQSDQELLMLVYRPLVEAHTKIGDHEKIIRYAGASLELKADDLWMLNTLSRSYHACKQMDKQATVDQKIFFLDREDSSVSARLIPWFESISDLQNAIFHLKNHLKYQPKDLENWWKLAQYAKQSSMPGLCIHALDEVQKLASDQDSRYKDINLFYGKAYLELNRPEKAAEYFQRHLGRDPHNAGLRFQLGKIYSEEGFHQKARVTFSQIMKSDPGNTTVLFEYANALYMEGKPQQAYEELERLFKLKPYYTQAHLLKGKILYESGKNREAIQAFDEVLRVEPNHKDALLMQARLYRSEGLLSEAVEVYDKLWRNHRDEEYLLEMSMMNLKLNRKAKAMEQLRVLTTDRKVSGRISKLAKGLLRQNQLRAS